MGKITIGLLISIVALASLVAASLFVEYYYPTTGTISTLGLSVKWLDGLDVSTIDWLVTENSTEYIMDPMNITNISNVPVNLILSYSYETPTNIIDLQLTWNYTGNPLGPNDWEIIEIYQKCTAKGAYDYETIITAEEAST